MTTAGIARRWARRAPWSALRLALRRDAKTAAMAALANVGESRIFLLEYLLRFLRVGVLLALWHVILAGRGPVSGMTLAQVLTYTLISEVFAEQFLCRTQITDDLWQGTIATRLLHPVSLVEHYFADVAGRWAAGLALVSLPLLVLAAPLLGVDPRPASPLAGALFVVSLALAIGVALALEFCFAGLTLALEQPVWVIARMRVAVTVVLSGSLLPLTLLPWGIGNVFNWLPFAATASAPLQIYIGTGHPALLLLSQAGWCVVMWAAAGWLWRANRERLVGYGG